LKVNTSETIDIFGSWMEVGMIVAAFIAGMFFIAFPLVKKFKQTLHRNRSNTFDSPDFIHTHTQIHEWLTELRVSLYASRAYISQFHNGGEFLTGTSMKKFSLTHESCYTGVAETRESRHDVLLTLYPELLQHLQQNTPELVMTSELPECYFKRTLEISGVVMLSLLPIKCLKGVKTIGYISLEWCDFSKADKVDETQLVLKMLKKRRFIEAEFARCAK
jgi:hypothetical protein